MGQELKTERTAKTILLEMVEAVKSGKAKDLNNPQLWASRAFELNILLLDEKALLENMRQKVAIRAFGITQTQDKKNVALARMEKETWNEYKDMKIQEGVVEIIEEQIKLSKKNIDLNSF